MGGDGLNRGNTILFFVLLDAFGRPGKKKRNQTRRNFFCLACAKGEFGEDCGVVDS